MTSRPARRTQPIRVALCLADCALRACVADICEDAGIAVADIDEPIEDADAVLTDRPIETAVPMIALASDRARNGWPTDVRAWVPADVDAATLAAIITVVAAGYVLAPHEDEGKIEGGQNGGGKDGVTWADLGPADDVNSALSAREREVLALIAEGASNKEIARTLALSVHTVKFHVASLMEKLGARSRVDAVAIAIRAGLAMV